MELAIMGTTIKLSISKAWMFILPVVVFFFDPEQGRLMLALFSLSLLDMFGWGYYHYNLDKFDNKKWGWGTVGKILKYASAIAAARVLEYFLTGIPYSQNLDSYVLAVLALKEAKSFYTCLSKLGVKVPIIPKLNKVLEEL